MKLEGVGLSRLFYACQNCPFNNPEKWSIYAKYERLANHPAIDADITPDMNVTLLTHCKKAGPPRRRRIILIEEFTSPEIKCNYIIDALGIISKIPLKEELIYNCIATKTDVTELCPGLKKK